MSLALLPLLAVSALAGSARPEAASTSLSAHRASVGLRALDGALVGGGPGYRVRLDRGGLALTPAFGRDVAASHPLTLAFAALERGGAEVAGLSVSGAPRQEGNLAVYERGAGVAELYELRAEGVEQSYRFAQPPAGSGDLSVRLRLSTDLAPRALATGGIAFELAGEGAVTVGGVTGIDARGRRVQGTVELAGGELLLSLPDAFVASAAYPLVLDPLIGVSFELGAGQNEFAPDVAYLTSDVWLAVWQVEYSSADMEIRGQMLDVAGAPLGGLLTIAGGSPFVRQHATVCGSGAFDEFGVAWEQADSAFGPFAIRCASVRGLDGWVSGELELPGAPASCTEPDAGAGWTAADPHLVFVYREEGAGIRAAFVVPAAGGDPALAGDLYVSSDPLADRPAVSKSGGNGGLYAAVWQTGGDVHAALLENSGGVIMPEVALFATLDEEEQPDVDGFAQDFSVACVRRSGGASEVVCASFNYNLDSGVLSLYGVAPTVVASALDVRLPSVCMDDSMVSVAWSERQAGIDYDLLQVDISLLDGQSCAAPVFVASGFPFADAPAMASRQQGGNFTEDRLLLAWTEIATTFPFTGSVHAQQLDAGGGPVVDLGGGCGGGGQTFVAGQAVPGNSGFTVGLMDQDPAAFFGLLNLSLAGAPTFDCGACTFNPFKIVFSHALEPDLSETYQPLPIPCQTDLIGASFDFQWSVLGTTETPCSFFAHASLSNTLRVTVGP